LRSLSKVHETVRFDDLPIPFRAVAADIVTGEKVVFDQGDLAMAIRASMSVPGVFAPVRIDGHLLVDGGVLDNLPIDEARKLGAQRLIVSRVGTPLADEAHLDSPLAISQQTERLLMKRIVEAQVATLGPDDLLLVPQLGTLGAQEFNRAAEASAIGLAAAEQRVEGIRRYSVDEAEYAQFRSAHTLPRYQAPQVAFVEVLEDHTRTGQHVRSQFDGLQGKPLDAAEVEARIAEVYGESRYQQMQWRLVEDPRGTGLQVEPEDKRWGPAYLHGTLRLSSDLDGHSDYQLLAEYTRTGLNPRGGEAQVRLGVGRIDSLDGQFHQPFGWKDDQALVAALGYRAFDLPLLAVDGADVAQFRYSHWGGGIGWRYAPGHRWELSLDAGRYRERTRLLVGDPHAWSGSSANLAALSVGLRHDTLDSAAFPRGGQRLDAGYRQYLDTLGGEVKANRVHLAWDGVVSRGPHSLLAGVAVSSASDGGGQVLATQDFLGGLGRLSGYQEDAIFAPQTALARAVYYRRIGHADGLVQVPVYAGGSLEMGGYWRRRDDIGRDGLRGAGSAFLGLGTPLGPVLLGYGRAEGGMDSFYLMFGSLLHDRSEP
ncbi:MAG: patatin-like phospholipase family protein, partial [Luteimonas sp.]|nr:patatin-like phospholipase family protein [Luteimonas sp.]